MIQESKTEAGASIAMAARGTERVHRDQHARSGHDTGIDGVAEADVDELVTTDIANGGEAGHECFAGIDSGTNGDFGNSALQPAQRSAVIVGVEFLGKMSMGVYKTWQEGSVAQIDDRGASWNIAAAYGLDLTVGDDDKSRLN